MEVSSDAWLSVSPEGGSWWTTCALQKPGGVGEKDKARKSIWCKEEEEAGIGP